MPIILASLVFAVALAALPSTEPPDDEEQKAYVAHIAAQREKKRLHSMRLQGGEQGNLRRSGLKKIGPAGVTGGRDRIETSENVDGGRGVQRHPPSFGLALGSAPESERPIRSSTRSSIQARSRIVSEIFPFPSVPLSASVSSSSALPSTTPVSVSTSSSRDQRRGYGHLRRSSSVPSFGRRRSASPMSSGFSTGTSSAASSPEASPRLCSTPFL
ncbi:hypothetical protein I317_05527 [Kwoniella heveanensis CBS 569]|nr:hypothetical protein I317_05527 [Kwoniella heveanensis CBS 569]